MKLWDWITKPHRDYREAQEERREAREDYERAVAEQNMLLKVLETGEPQRMPERFIEAQKREGRPIEVKPGPNYHRVFGEERNG